MGFLSPIFLLAGLAVAVPLILHLFHRHDAKRMVFPALQYLLRTEKEHARTIRFRQLLLLLLRIAAVLLLVGAGARPFLRGGGGVHEPTATVLILDNSMSSGLIRGGARVLDLLKAVALRSIERASDEDRIWLIRAGEPWEPAITGSRADLRAAVLETDATDARGDLRTALERAVVLASGAGLPAAEIHLISDLQASAFGGIGSPTGAVPIGAVTAGAVPTGAVPAGAVSTGSVPGEAGAIPVVVFDDRSGDRENTYLDSLMIGGGLPPLANQRTSLSVRLAGDADSADVPLRLVTANRIRGATTAGVGISALLPIGPFAAGDVDGYVETDPDDLRADDRRFFAFRVRSAPTLAMSGSPPFFLSEAIPVLIDAGRISLAPIRDAEILISVAGTGVTEAAREGRAVIVLPPNDPALLPGLNRALTAAGIPWRYGPATAVGEAGVTRWSGPVNLDDVRIRSHYTLIPEREELNRGVLVTLSSGQPWLVEGTTPRGAYLLVASALDEESTNLPLTAALMPLLEWMVSRWGDPQGTQGGVIAGTPINPPPGATNIRDPSGTLHPVDATQPFAATPKAGLYEVLAGDSTIQIIAVNAPREESLLLPIETGDLRDLLPGPATLVRDSARWTRALFSGGQGPEIWRWLLVAAALVLVAESLVAASGPSPHGSTSAAPPALQKTVSD